MATFQQLDDLYTHANSTLSNLDALITQLEDCALEQAFAVAFVTPSSSMGKNDAPKDVLVKLYTADEEPLAQAVTIDVEDGGGTAEPGVHYNFSPSSVTFPVNSPNGDTETVTVTPIPNAISSDKIAVLKLNPGKLGTVVKHEVDLAACEEWCYLLPLDDWFDTSDAEVAYYSCNFNTQLALAPGELITLSGAPTWKAKDTSGWTMIRRSIRFYVPAETTLESVRMSYTFADGGGNTDAWFKIVRVNTSQVCYTSFPPFPPWGVTGLSLSDQVVECQFQLALNGINGNRLAITEIRLEGTGVPLFGICDNC